MDPPALDRRRESRRRRRLRSHDAHVARRGFGTVTKIPTDGSPASSPRSMPARRRRWASTSCMTSSRWTRRSGRRRLGRRALVDKPGLGKVRGRTRRRQSERPARPRFWRRCTRFAAPAASCRSTWCWWPKAKRRSARRIFRRSCAGRRCMAALKKCIGIFMPSAAQGLDGAVTMTLGAKGVVELELVSSGERWGRGPRQDLHSSNKARVDSPGVAPGAGAGHAGLRRRQRSCDRRVRRQSAPALRGREGHDRGGRAAPGRSDHEEAARRGALGARCELAGSRWNC